MSRRTLNDTPFSHNLNDGIEVKAERCDFVGGIDVYVPANVTQEQLASAMLGLGAWHWANIVPELNGFTGPPTVRIHKR